MRYNYANGGGKGAVIVGGSIFELPLRKFLQAVLWSDEHGNGPFGTVKMALGARPLLGSKPDMLASWSYVFTVVPEGNDEELEQRAQYLQESR